MIQFDISIHPVILFLHIYEYNYMESKKEGKSRKNHQGVGGEVRWLIIRLGTLRIFYHACQIVKWDPLNEKQVVIKKPVRAM